MSIADAIEPKVEVKDVSTIDAASEKRAARRASVSGFVRDHPGLVVAGGVATGLVIGALIPRRAGKKVVRRTSALSKFIGAAAVSLGEDAAQRASVAGTQIRKGSHIVADHAEDWTALALRSASALAQSAAENMTKLGDTAAEKAEKLGDVAADRIGKVGDQTSKGWDKAVPVAEAAAAHAGKRVGDAIAQLRARIVG